MKTAPACFAPDPHSGGRPLTVVQWVYAPAEQGARQMLRVGITAEAANCA